MGSRSTGETRTIETGRALETGCMVEDKSRRPAGQKGQDLIISERDLISSTDDSIIHVRRVPCVPGLVTCTLLAYPIHAHTPLLLRSPPPDLPLLFCGKPVPLAFDVEMKLGPTGGKC